MKNLSIVITVALSIILSACKKDTEHISMEEPQNVFRDSAIQFLKAKLPIEEFEALDFMSSTTLIYHNKAIGLKVGTRGSIDTFLFLYKESGRLLANRITISGLKSEVSKTHDGSITVEALDKTTRKKYIFQNNRVIETKIYNNATNVINSAERRYLGIQPEIQKVLPEIVIIGIVEVDAVNYFSLYWFSDQSFDYAELYSSIIGGGGSPGSGGGGGGTGNGRGADKYSNDNVSEVPTIPPPDKPIVDIDRELDCFTNNTSSTYDITVNVNQPVPNTRDIFNLSAAFRAGHVFLTLHQQNSDGSSIVRNIGFYPKNDAKPGNSLDESAFGDDSNTAFDVSLNFSVSGAEFETVLSSISEQQNKQYDLENFNCTDMVMEALSSVNINLPSTKSQELLFSGHNPADLGQDIRLLNLDVFSANNGNRQLIRNVSNTNSMTAPPKNGGC